MPKEIKEELCAEETISNLRYCCVGMSREEAMFYLRGVELSGDINSNVVGVGWSPRNGVVFELDCKGGH